MSPIGINDHPHSETLVDEAPPGIVVPKELLQPETLRALLIERATRDGTDYGLIEATLEDKIAELLELLDRGEAVITYDCATETCNIASQRELAGF